MPVSTEWIKGRLKEVGRTQSDLARRLRRDRSVISKMIRGQQTIKLDEIEHFCVVLKMSPADFVAKTVTIDDFYLKIEKYIPVYSPDLAMKVHSDSALYNPDLGFITFDKIDTIMTGNYTAIGIVLNDSSMTPLYKPGSIVIIDVMKQKPEVSKIYAYTNSGALYFGAYTQLAPGLPPRFLPISTESKYMSDTCRTAPHVDSAVGEVMLALATDESLPVNPVATGRRIRTNIPAAELTPHETRSDEVTVTQDVTQK
jgi:transcriptional regulator with XRE-family HTH domain